jgi:predicted Rossmann fold nucleotide-binding protein DprA/Smf involved in DNA uptake
MLPQPSPIYALSTATLVVAAEAEQGGIWAGATEAIRQFTAPVLVWTGGGAGNGNALLAERGATALHQLSDLFPLPNPAPQASEATGPARAGGLTITNGQGGRA